jgi:hypothetical protein
MRIRFSLFGLFLTLAASPVLAQCPSGADLANGIRLEDQRSKTTSVFTRASPDAHLIEKRRGGTAGETGVQTTWYLNGLTPGATDRNGYETRFVHLSDPRPKLARLGNGLNQTSVRFRIMSSGRELDTGRTTFTYEGRAQITISNCRYDALKIRTDTKLASGAHYTWRQFYAPEIDIALRSEKLNQQGRTLSANTYNTISKAR